MAKVHMKSSWSEDAMCQWNPNQTLTITEDISEVTCRVCLREVAPHQTLAELKERAESALEK